MSCAKNSVDNYAAPVFAPDNSDTVLAAQMCTKPPWSFYIDI